MFSLSSLYLLHLIILYLLAEGETAAFVLGGSPGGLNGVKWGKTFFWKLASLIPQKAPIWQI